MDNPLHATVEEFAAQGFTHVESHCPRCRVTRLRPISWLPRISMGLTIAQLSARLRCAECGGELRSVKPWAIGRCNRQAARAARMNVAAQLGRELINTLVHEVVTVISGTARLGMGESADQARAERLPTGSFFALPPGMPHYAFAEEDTVIQLNSFGPWSLNYVRPEDDPRKQTQ